VTYATHHLVSVVSFLMTLALLAKVLGEPRAPTSTIAWLLAIALVPWIGVPFYLVFGNRKLTRLRRDKRPLRKDADEKTEGAISLRPTGEAAYAAMRDLIDGARRYVYIETFILGDDEVGWALTSRLVARAREGLDVRLLLDGFFAPRAPKARLEALRAAGGQVAIFLPVFGMGMGGHANLRNHRKLAIADGNTAIVGGMNLATEYMGPTPDPSRWRDLAAVVSGPVVAQLQDVFAADWEFADKRRTPLLLPEAASGVAAALTTPIRVVASGPDTEADTVYDELLALFFTAKERIWMVTPYFIPDESLAHALALAARRGVDVRLIIPNRSNHLLADLAGGSFVRRVQDAGGHVLRYPRMIHAKACIVDSTLAMFGSANLDMRSLFLDYEIALGLSSEAAVAMMADWFEEQSRDAVEGLDPATRARLFAENLGRLAAPLV
jgi:cardiolipin synthase